MHTGASEWAQKNTEKSKNRFINDAFVHVHNLMANEFSRSFFLFFFFSFLLSQHFQCQHENNGEFVNWTEQ